MWISCNSLLVGKSVLPTLDGAGPNQTRVILGEERVETLFNVASVETSRTNKGSYLVNIRYNRLRIHTIYITGNVSEMLVDCLSQM